MSLTTNLDPFTLRWVADDVDADFDRLTVRILDGESMNWDKQVLSNLRWQRYELALHRKRLRGIATRIENGRTS